MSLCAFEDAARAQHDVVPLALAYDAPAECPDATAFFRQVAARTVRVREAGAGANARTLHVLIGRRGRAFAGELWIEEAGASSSARAVTGAACADVVGALSLVAAIAVETGATPPSSAPQEAAPASSSATDGSASGQATSERAPKELGTGVAAAPPAAAGAAAVGADPPAALRRHEEARSATSAPRHFAAGLQLELAEIADAVVSGRVFAEIESSSAWSPSLRVALARSLDADRQASVGGATLRFTDISLEVCPFIVAISGSLALRPCAGTSGGILEAQGRGVNNSLGKTRPWVTAFGHARLRWGVLGALGVEVEAGLLAPLYRDSFFFNVNLPVYRAPPVAFVGRVGVGARFP